MCQITSTTAAANIRTTSRQNSVPDILPEDQLSRSAYSYVKTRIHPDLLAHSLRVFYYAKKLSTEPALLQDFVDEPAWHAEQHLPFLFVACMFHDYGASSTCDDGPWRFEVEGADAAVAFLTSQGVTDRAITHAVWTAIACHTTPHVAERMSAITKLLRLGPLCDFHRLSTGSVQVGGQLADSDGKRIFLFDEDILSIETAFPRGEIEVVLSNSVVAQARRPGMSGKAPEATWPGGLVAFADAHPAWQGLTKAF